jgi:hypothetical protein
VHKVGVEADGMMEHFVAWHGFCIAVVFERQVQPALFLYEIDLSLYLLSTGTRTTDVYPPAI